MSITQRLRLAASRWRMTRRVKRFGNNHSPTLNRHYVDYHDRARQAFDGHRHPITANAEELARQLHEQGFLALPPAISAEEGRELKKKVDEAFDRKGNTYPFGTGGVRLMDGLEQIPEVTNLMSGEMEQLLLAYYRSHFKIYAVTIYRIFPDENAPESSFLWHFDNAPDLQLKLMFYLDETYDNTGAFRFKSREESERARSFGFWHRDDYERARSVFDDTSTTHVVEGEPGTAVFFQPGRVVHKATAPRRSHRDVAVLVINPSIHYWREHLARNRHLLSTNAGLCMNLDTDQAENVGYRF